MPERGVQINVLADIAQPETSKKDHHISGSQAEVGVEVRFPEAGGDYRFQWCEFGKRYENKEKYFRWLHHVWMPLAESMV